MRNWYLYIESDENLEPVAHRTGVTSMPPGQFLSRKSIMYIVSTPALEKTMRLLGMDMKTHDNLKGAIAAYYTGIA